MEKVDVIKSRIKYLLKHSELTQKQIADAVNVSQSCIAHYAKGDILPALDTFAKLCEVLDTDANYILGLSDN